MIRLRPVVATTPPALRRLETLAGLDGQARQMLLRAMAEARTHRARRDIIAEGAPIAGPRLIVSGWAARARTLADGRRQFLSFLLPGDLFGLCRQPAPLSVSTVTALTEVTTCLAPSAPALDRAYALSAAVEEAYLLEHIARLGRLNALERIYSLLLEFDERLTSNGMAADGTFDMPLTQEMLGDALGLTSVHVNRMLQEARRAGRLDLNGGRVRLRDPQALNAEIGRSAVRVSEFCG